MCVCPTEICLSAMGQQTFCTGNRNRGMEERKEERNWCNLLWQKTQENAEDAHFSMQLLSVWLRTVRMCNCSNCHATWSGKALMGMIFSCGQGTHFATSPFKLKHNKHNDILFVIALQDLSYKCFLMWHPYQQEDLIFCPFQNHDKKYIINLGKKTIRWPSLSTLIW